MCFVSVELKLNLNYLYIVFIIEKGENVFTIICLQSKSKTKNITNNIDSL